MLTLLDEQMRDKKNLEKIMKEFKVGDVWKTKEGELVIISEIEDCDHLTFPLRASSNRYTIDGRWSTEVLNCGKDLMEKVGEFKEPK